MSDSFSFFCIYWHLYFPPSKLCSIHPHSQSPSSNQAQQMQISSSTHFASDLAFKPNFTERHDQIKFDSFKWQVFIQIIHPAASAPRLICFHWFRFDHERGGGGEGGVGCAGSRGDGNRGEQRELGLAGVRPVQLLGTELGFLPGWRKILLMTVSPSAVWKFS